MSVQSEWGNSAKTYINITLIGRWTWTEFDLMVDQTCAMLRSVNHHVDILGDIRQSLPPIYGLSGGHLRRALDQMPPNLGKLIVVGRGYITTTLFRMLVKVHPLGSRKTVFVDSMDEGLKCLSMLQAQHTYTHTIVDGAVARV